ncbi:MAG TPA: extracellular solute-binding protein, partial [Myxococcota bacterium]|nr:extracellular solute-binding protein [Myxococcota bacterium]
MRRPVPRHAGAALGRVLVLVAITLVHGGVFGAGATDSASASAWASASASASPSDSDPDSAAGPQRVVLWHAYRGAEAAGLEAAVDAFRARTGGRVTVEVLAVPYEVLGSKLTTAIPRGHGPDLFVLAHERLGDFEASHLVRPFPGPALGEAEAFAPGTLEALRGPATGRLYGLPLAYKCVALFYRPSLVPRPPATVDELVRMAEAASRPDEGRYGLVYEAGSFYHHAVWMHAFGGALFDGAGGVVFASPANAASLAFARTLVVDKRVTPEEASGALVTELWNAGRAAMSINGPWFVGEIAPGVDWAVAPMPPREGRPAAPYLTVEGIFAAASADGDVRDDAPGRAAATAPSANGDGATPHAPRGATATAPAADGDGATPHAPRGATA